ncbi:hypothetical protein VTK26DRAFT_6202 [Humicola hyalothermophila]
MSALNQRNRGLPFLHRNWLKATNHWNNRMGNKASSQSRDAPDKLDTIADHDDRSHERVAKRRRLNNDYDGFPLFEGYATTQRALRIEVLKISHKDSPRVKNGILNGVVAPNVKDVVRLRARCKLTILGQKAGEQVVLHVDSQLCDVRVFKNPAGLTPMARFSSINPFIIPEDKIFIERDDDAVFGLGNHYSVLIELESAGDAHWPPADLVPVNDEDTFYNRGAPSRQWVLTAKVADILNRGSSRKSARLRVKKHVSLDIPTSFLMDIDVRWSLNAARPPRGKDQIQASINVVDPEAPEPALVNGGLDGVNGINGHRPVNGEPGNSVNGQSSGSPVDLGEELAEGELTPGRSRRRARQDINYNVKQMWNNAVGRETRKRRKLNDEHAQVDQHTVTYLLPPEQVQTDKFECLLCGAENERLSQLRAHYSCHPQYDFNFEFRPKAGYCVTVKPSASNHDSPLRPKVYQLGLPVKPLDLDRYVDGDLSWVTSRLGPDNGREIFQDGHPNGPQSKPPAKRFATKRKKVLVPKTKQPLFDPLSKVQLVPGTPVPQHQLDDSWLLLKHRENLEDFIDLNPAEKEYLQEWDAFILQKHISSDYYLPRNFVRFVRDKASWIVAEPSRAEEFGKHVATLLARNVLPESAIIEATQLLNDARSRRRQHHQHRQSEADPEPSSSAQQTANKKKKPTGGCCAVCAEPVAVPAMVICANKECKNRLYHDTCVENPEEASAKGRLWKCKVCCP